MREANNDRAPGPAGGKALARLVDELVRAGLTVHAEAAALFGAPGVDPVGLVADIAGPGYQSPGPYPSAGEVDGLVERTAVAYDTVAAELTESAGTPGPLWRSLGPVTIPNGQTYGASRINVSGRVSALAVDPRDSGHLLAGAANGGVWETRDDGLSWRPRTDDAPTLAIGAVAFDPSDPGVILAGTGEGNAFSWLGAGVLRSADGGTTWSRICTDPFMGKGFFDLVFDGDQVYAATTAGLFVSTDGGVKWTRRRDGITWSVCVAEDEVLSAGRDGVFRSTDHAATWEAVALPGGPQLFDRLAAAIAPAAPSVAYVWGAAGGLPFLWIRASGVWSPVDVPADADVGQASYDWLLAVAPDDPRQVYCGAIDVHRGDLDTVTGTWRWTNITTKRPVGESIHPDQHVIAFAPGDPGTIYVGNDGGVFRSPDRGVTWQHLNNGLVISEFEYLAHDHGSAAWLIGGTQDNGTQSWLGASEWEHVADGDGGDCAVNQNNPEIVVHSFQKIRLEISPSKGAWGSWRRCTPPLAPGEDSLFYPPVEASATTGDTFAAGYSALHLSRDNCAGWMRLPIPGQRTRASAMYIPDGDHVYVGTRDGRLYATRWNETRWEPLDQLSTPRPGTAISDIVVDPRSPGTIWLTNATAPGSGPDGGRVWRSTDAGTTWTDRSQGLPLLPMNAIVIDPADSDRVWVAADLGVYQSLDAGATWRPFANGLPNAFIGDIIFHPRARVLRAGTRSRGVWEVPVDDAA